jgi:antitoxin HicB
MSKYDGNSSLKQMLEDDGAFESVTARATKRALVLDIQDAMKIAKVGKSDLARRMETSRAQLDRLLSVDSTGVTLDTMVKLSNALGRRLEVRLV